MVSPLDSARFGHEGAETRQSLRHLLVVLVSTVGCVALTYLAPPLHWLRPWTPGDPIPFADKFGLEGTELPTFAGAGAFTDNDEAVQERLEETLGEAVAQNLGTPPPPPPAVEEATGPRTVVDPSEYAGIDQHLVDPSGDGMRPFYEALLETAEAEGKPGPITRIAHYGDSSIATDLITHTVRRRLQRRFGDAGHGFMLAARGTMPYGHRDVSHWASERWQAHEVTRSALSDGRYGFGGVVVTGAPGARADFGTDEDSPVGGAVSRFEIWARERPAGGRVRVRIDGGEPEVLDLGAEEERDVVRTFEVPDGPHEMVLRHMGGRVMLYGVVLERDGPGVVYDSLGLVGARANRLLNFDEEHIRSQIERRGTNLLILGFGGNESSDPIEEESYYRSFLEVIDRMRGDREDLACLIMAPMDQAERRGGGIQTLAGVPLIVSAQRRAAREKGCAFFDTWAAMGGAGSMRRWYRARPRLALSDFRHATPAGYEIIGNMLYKALLEGFAGYLAELGDDVERAPSAEEDPHPSEITVE